MISANYSWSEGALNFFSRADSCLECVKHLFNKCEEEACIAACLRLQLSDAAVGTETGTEKAIKSAVLTLCELSNDDGKQWGTVPGIHWSSCTGTSETLTEIPREDTDFCEDCAESLWSLCPWSIQNPVEHSPEKPVPAASTLGRGLDYTISGGTSTILIQEA